MEIPKLSSISRAGKELESCANPWNKETPELRSITVELKARRRQGKRDKLISLVRFGVARKLRY